MKCTWEDCQAEAKFPQLDNDGKEWANLCQDHHDKIETTLGDLSKTKQMLSYWVKAQGGAKAAADRVLYKR